MKLFNKGECYQKLTTYNVTIYVIYVFHTMQCVKVHDCGEKTFNDIVNLMDI